MSQTHRCRTAIRSLTSLTALAPLAAGLAACSSSGDPLTSTPYNAAGQIVYSAADGARQVDPSKPLTVKAKGGSRITDVTATDNAGRFVRGALNDDGTEWHSTGPLAAGARYTVRVSTENGDGAPGAQTVTFSTKPAGNQLNVTFGPDAGTYGVGEPVTASLSRPVHDRAARARVERALHVTSTPAVTGSWYWVDDKSLHFRPQHYWPAHASVTVSASLGGAQIARGVFGGAAKPVTFDTGDEIVALTNAATHELTFYRDGDEVRTMPVTTGKPGFDTRNGIKVVLEKQSFVQMKSSTVGIAAGSSNSYDLPVHWATRVTWSGEYVHAAPWSVGSQGVANTSHGCTGMSTGNAEWFFNEIRPGDLVEVVGSGGHDMEHFGNGFGDWNLSWPEWLKGSALGARATAGSREDNRASRQTQAARLTPRI